MVFQRLRGLVPLMALWMAGMAPPISAGERTPEVAGHGKIGLHQISIRAWAQESGQVGGFVQWQVASVGYPWLMEVTGLWVEGKTARVEAVVVHSPLFPEEVGEVRYFTVVDRGQGASDPPDELGFGTEPETWTLPIEGGNFTIR